jgi:hypothetical protein
MKKFFVLLVVVAMTCFSAMAFAADVTVGGGVQVRSRDFNTMTFDKDVNAKNQVDTQTRIILNVNAKAGDDVKGKISLWNDFNDWASANRPVSPATPVGSDPGTVDQNFGNGFGSSAKDFGAFGFREAWINFNLPGIPVNVTAGHQLLQLGDGWFFRAMHFGSDAWVVANVTGNNTIAVVDVKFSEGQVFRTSDDVDAYVLLDVFKINDNMTVGANFTNGHLGSNNDIYNLGLNFAGTKLGPVNLKVQADWQSGENKTEDPKVKYQGYEFVAKGNVALDPVTINFMLGLGSGSKATDTDVKQMVTVLDIDPHYTFLYEYKLPTAANGGPYGPAAATAIHTGLANTTVASVGAGFAAAKSLNLGLDYYYLQATQKIVNGLGDESSDIGQEIDAKVYWKLYDNLTWNWDLGYFMPGKAYKTASGKSDAATGIQGVLALSF